MSTPAMSTPPLPRSPFAPQVEADFDDILRRSAVLPPGLLPSPEPTTDHEGLFLKAGEAGRDIARFMDLFFTNTLARKGAINLVEIVLEAMKAIDHSLDALGVPSTPETRSGTRSETRRKGVKKSPKKPAAKKGPAPKRRRSLQDKAGSFTAK